MHLAHLRRIGVRAAVRNVNQPDLVYPGIQEAIDAASEGDILIVAGGSYSPFTIDGLSLSVIVHGNQALISGTVQVVNLEPYQTVYLSGLTV